MISLGQMVEYFQAECEVIGIGDKGWYLVKDLNTELEMEAREEHLKLLIIEPSD